MDKKYTDQYKKTRSKLPSEHIKYQGYGNNQAMREGKKILKNNTQSANSQKNSSDVGFKNESLKKKSSTKSILGKNEEERLLKNNKNGYLKNSDLNKSLKRADSKKNYQHYDQIINVSNLSNLLSRKPTYLEIRNRKAIRTQNTSLSSSNLNTKYNTIALKKDDPSYTKTDKKITSCAYLNDKQEHENIDLNDIYSRTALILQARVQEQENWRIQRDNYETKIKILYQELQNYRQTCRQCQRCQKS